MTARPFKLVLLAWALLLGVALEVPLVAFSLHFGLWFSAMANGVNWVYWALSGALFAFGLGIGLVVVPWHRLGVRLVCATVLLVVFAAWGVVHA
jgi:hypothetical protein